MSIVNWQTETLECIACFMGEHGKNKTNLKKIFRWLDKFELTLGPWLWDILCNSLLPSLCVLFHAHMNYDRRSIFADRTIINFSCQVPSLIFPQGFICYCPRQASTHYETAAGIRKKQAEGGTDATKVYLCYMVDNNCVWPWTNCK